MDNIGPELHIVGIEIGIFTCKKEPGLETLLKKQ